MKGGSPQIFGIGEASDGLGKPHVFTRFWLHRLDVGKCIPQRGGLRRSRLGLCLENIELLRQLTILLIGVSVATRELQQGSTSESVQRFALGRLGLKSNLVALTVDNYQVLSDVRERRDWGVPATNDGSGATLGENLSGNNQLIII